MDFVYFFFRRDRRINQLIRHEQYDRECSAKMDKLLANQRKRANKNRSVRFIHSVMLLEAAARNDIDEGISFLKLYLNIGR